MTSNKIPCSELEQKLAEARHNQEDARQRARQEVITESLDPENMPPALHGSKIDDPYQQEKEASKLVEELEKQLQDCP